jgi:hypothetical protein
VGEAMRDELQQRAERLAVELERSPAVKPGLGAVP